MTQLGFCGLGQMGALMAGRLVDAGHDVAVWNRTQGQTDELVERGARAATSPADAASAADGVITMLADPEAVNSVVFGHDGVAAGLGGGATLIEMSTVGVDVARDVGSRLGDARMIDAPVLGSTPQAQEGNLKIFVGGPDDLYDRWVPVLGTLGNPMHLGPLGAGAAMKLVVNSVLGAAMTAFGEAMALADRFGLDEADVLDVLAESPIGPTVKSKRNKIEQQTYPPNFKLSLAAKDLRLVQNAAVRAGLDARVAKAAAAALGDAEGAGLGNLDYSALVAHLRGHVASG